MRVICAEEPARLAPALRHNRPQPATTGHNRPKTGHNRLVRPTPPPTSPVTPAASPARSSRAARATARSVGRAAPSPPCTGAVAPSITSRRPMAKAALNGLRADAGALAIGAPLTAVCAAAGEFAADPPGQGLPGDGARQGCVDGASGRPRARRARAGLPSASRASSAGSSRRWASPSAASGDESPGHSDHSALRCNASRSMTTIAPYSSCTSPSRFIAIRLWLQRWRDTVVRFASSSCEIVR
jgi:hypothetical protein